jgi:excisionase family DNA binding protein
MYLTFAETCERLRVSHETLRKLIKSELLQAHKIGTARTSPYRISEQAIDEYIKRQTVAAAS